MDAVEFFKTVNRYLSITCRCDRCRDDYWNEEVTDND